MRLYTVHAEPPKEREGPEGWPPPRYAPTVLLRDGFSIYPFLFGALWFLVQRLWLEAVVMLALSAAAVLLLPDRAAGVALLALHLVAGFEGRARLGAKLARQGRPVVAVVAAPDMDLAWFRLVAQRPDLVRKLP